MDGGTTLIEAKSFKDRKGNKVTIGDLIGYFHINGEMKDSGKVRRIKKEGYFISIYTEGRTWPWFKQDVEKLTEGYQSTESS